MTFTELRKEPPRAIAGDDELLARNTGVVQGFLIFAAILVIGAGIFSYTWKGKLTTTLFYIGGSLGLIFGIIGYAFSVNSKKSLAILQNGTHTFGIIEKINIPVDYLAPGKLPSATYINLEVSYLDNKGDRYYCYAAFVGRASAKFRNEKGDYVSNDAVVEPDGQVKKNAGDSIDVLYMPDRPDRCCLVLENVGALTVPSKKVDQPAHTQP